jgi:NAD(P)-dependent dehydrogenase (short-subunit alcohol dehydrogenase family)
MGTIAITGSASGIGAATAARLREAGHTVIGVDRRDADVVADLGTPAGREAAIAAIGERSAGVLDGLVTCAGLGPLPSRPGSAIVSVNYFGTVVLLEGLRPLLAAAAAPAAVAISSNSVTTSAGIPADVVAHCLAGDEAAARAAADAAGGLGGTYQASKLALARWVRRHAVRPEWIGAGIRLNAVAPGMTETAMIAEGRADPTMGPLLDRFPIPAGRAGRPEEIAAVIAFLLGPESTFVCGSLVFVDGGTDALMRADDWPAPLPEPARPAT